MGNQKRKKGTWGIQYCCGMKIERVVAFPNPSWFIIKKGDDYAMKPLNNYLL